MFVNTGEVVQDVAVGVAQHAQATAFEEGGASGVVVRVHGVAVAVDFDDEL